VDELDEDEDLVLLTDDEEVLVDDTELDLELLVVETAVELEVLLELVLELLLLLVLVREPFQLPRSVSFSTVGSLYTCCLNASVLYVSVRM
jgi:hypothetical protein